MHTGLGRRGQVSMNSPFNAFLMLLRPLALEAGMSDALLL